MQDSVKINREHYIGGSDIPIIMNLSPFRTRFELLQEKAGYLQNDFDGNVYTDYGNIMEPRIRQFINRSRKTRFVEGKHYATIPATDDIEIRCHTDGENEDSILEIKTTSQIFPKLEDYKLYLVQILFYMFIAEKPKGVLAVYDRPEDMSTDFDKARLQVFDIRIEDYVDTVEEINKAITRFLVDLDKVRANPFISEEELMDKDVQVLANQLAVISTKLQEYETLKKEYEEQKKSLLKAMQNHGVKSFRTEDGTLITVVDGRPAKDVEIEAFDTLTFQEDHPKLYKAYLKSEIKHTNGSSAFLKITFHK